MRSKAKMINYGIVYGLSDYGLADRLNIPREEAKEFIDAYLERFPRVAAFMAETIERAKEEGYVKTLWGRRRQIPELRPATTRCARSASAWPSTPSSRARRRTSSSSRWSARHAALAASGLQTKLLLTIHDELLFEGPPGEAGRRARADRARDVRRVGRTTRRWPSTSAWARTGWRRSEHAGAGAP